MWGKRVLVNEGDKLITHFKNWLQKTFGLFQPPRQTVPEVWGCPDGHGSLDTFPPPLNIILAGALLTNKPASCPECGVQLEKL
jgi:hypothetical protein